METACIAWLMDTWEERWVLPDRASLGLVPSPVLVVRERAYEERLLDAVRHRGLEGLRVRQVALLAALARKRGCLPYLRAGSQPWFTAGFQLSCIEKWILYIREREMHKFYTRALINFLR